MADSVFKLVVDSKEYDSKIQRATSGLMAFEKKCREVGGTLEFVEKEDLDFVKALGKMETVSQSASGKIAELSKAFTELSLQYKHLTDAEKNSPYGKALAESLREIKTRIAESKDELASVSKQIGSGGLGGALDQLAGKFGVNISQLAGWGLAIGAAKGALDLAKDAFLNSETNLDEWGRVVQSSESLYKSFLSALNTGDVGGFLSRIDEIVAAAREAYDALDQLGTFTAFNQRNVARSRANYAQALDAYRLNPTAENKQTLAAANQQVMTDLNESHKMTEEAYQKALRNLAEGRLSSKALQDAFVQTFSEGTWTDLLSAKASYSKGRSLNSGQQYFNGMRTYGGRVDESGSGQWRDMTDLEKQQFEFARALSEVNDSQIKEVQALGAQSIQITEQIYQQDRAYNRLAGNNAPLSRGGSAGSAAAEAPIEGSIKAQEAEVDRLTELWKNATAELRDGYKAELDEAKRVLDQMVNKTEQLPQELNQTMNGPERTPLEQMQQSIRIQQADAAALLDENTLKTLLGVAIQNGIDGLDLDFSRVMDEMREGLDISPEAWQELEAKINEQLAALNLDPIKLDVNTGALATATNDAKSMQGAWQMAASAISAAGSAMQMIEDPAAKVAGIIAQAIAQVALGAGQAIAFASNGSAGGPWGWLAFAISATATMVSTIAAIKSTTKGYASGGMVEGTSYSGDNIVARLNAGEGVLTAKGVENAETLAGIAEGNGGGVITGTVTGANIYLALANFAKQNNKLAGSTTGGLVLKIE